jgi:NAD+ synthase
MLKTQMGLLNSGGVDSAVTSTCVLKQDWRFYVLKCPFINMKVMSVVDEHIKQLKNRYPNVSETLADLTSVLKV